MAALSEDSCLTVYPRPRPSHRDKTTVVTFEEEVELEHNEEEEQEVEVEMEENGMNVKREAPEHVPEIETMKDVREIEEVTFYIVLFY